MTRPWTAERIVDEAEARALIATVAPELDGAALSPLGAGWDNTAWLVVQGPLALGPAAGRAIGSFVFRFPRRQLAVACMEAELLALPRFPELPAPVTRPLWSGRMPARDGTWPFAGYRYLAGDILATHGRAPGDELGRFVRALHDIEVAPLVEAGVQHDPIARLDVARRMEPVGAALELAHRDGLDTRPHLEALARATHVTPTTTTAVCHGDLDPRHVLMAEGRLAGIIDWGDVNIGHPAMDLGLAFALPPVERAAFFAAYGPIPDDVATLARARAIMSAARVYEWALDIGTAPLAQYARTTLAHAIA